MAARMSYIGVKAVVVNGRVRDLAELSASGLHVSPVYTGYAFKSLRSY